MTVCSFTGPVSFISLHVEYGVRKLNESSDYFSQFSTCRHEEQNGILTKKEIVPSLEGNVTYTFLIVDDTSRPGSRTAFPNPTSSVLFLSL
jgi:hypothetical protein